MISLRPYQQRAVDLLYNYFTHNTGNPVLEAPTGAGKSVIQAAFIKDAIAHYPQTRVLCLTHVKELIEQNHLAMCRVYPEGSIGVHSASLGRRDTQHQILFAGIQSAARRKNELGAFDLVFIDECHLVNNRAAGQYRDLLKRLLLFNPKLKVVGFTATPYRLGGGMLTDGKERIFTDLISAESAGMSIRQLLDMGFLAPLTTAPVATRLDVSGVRTSRGDYVLSELGRAVSGDVTERACNEILRFGADRDGWLVFATTVEHGEQITAYLHGSGTPTQLVTGTTPDAERDELIMAYRKREIRCLVNVNVLSTGFDAPHTDLLAFLRPTKSPGLYVQACGRGMRIAPGKIDCLVLDFADNIAEHGPVDNVRPPKRRGKGGEAPMKECPQCGALLRASASVCSGCGQSFQIERGLSIGDKASSLAILSEGNHLETVEPTRVRCTIHRKPGKPKSLRVSWYCGLQRVADEWVCLFHDGPIAEKAARWWLQHVGGESPSTIEEAVDRASAMDLPEKLTISHYGQYPTIVGRITRRKAA